MLQYTPPKSCWYRVGHQWKGGKLHGIIMVAVPGYGDQGQHFSAPAVVEDWAVVEDDQTKTLTKVDIGGICFAAVPPHG